MMNVYVEKIHEIIEKVNPQLYVDSSNLTLMTYLIIAGIIFGIGILLSMLFKILPKFKTLTGDFGDDYKALFFFFFWSTSDTSNIGGDAISLTNQKYVKFRLKIIGF